MLTIFTANSASLRTIDRTLITGDFVRLVKEILQVDGEILSTDGPITITNLESESGRAVFILKVAGEPMLMCYACWMESKSETAWHAAESLFFEATELSVDINLDFGWKDVERPKVPWLFSVALPAFADVKDEPAEQLGAIEPCIVWALMDLDVT